METRQFFHSVVYFSPARPAFCSQPGNYTGFCAALRSRGERERSTADGAMVLFRLVRPENFTSLDTASPRSTGLFVRFAFRERGSSIYSFRVTLANENVLFFLFFLFSAISRHHERLLPLTRSCLSANLFRFLCTFHPFGKFHRTFDRSNQRLVSIRGQRNGMVFV